MPLGYKTAAAELAGAAEIAPRRLHTAGTAWLHPRTGPPRRVHGCAQDRKKINPTHPDSSPRSAGRCYGHSTPSWRGPSCATPSRASRHLPVPRLHCDEQEIGHPMASLPTMQHKQGGSKQSAGQKNRAEVGQITRVSRLTPISAAVAALFIAHTSGPLPSTGVTRLRQ